ncbi:MAG: RsmD family RNA methyltransferase, partial [Planctomycetota bacterium]|nr:RsmD family RNA methyltransferase [Planctomycetota bacterium]
MSLKIIGGVYGSRVLKSVRGLGTRPLLGQVREALFNILAEEMPGAIVWDLFAGSGASGIEALSHGAQRVLFLEKNGRAADVIKQNLQMLGPDAVSRAMVMRADAWDPPAISRAVFGGGRDAAPAETGGAASDAPNDAPNDAPSDAPNDAPSEGEVAPDVVFLDPPY